MVEFIKMHGIGNDYIYIDCIAHPMPTDIEEFARHASDRHTGIGGDGVVLILPSDVADCRMRMFNADGSEGRMCGNAIRCVGKYYYETYTSKTQGTRSKEQGAENAKCIIPNSSFPIPHSSLSVETLSGTKHLTLNVIDNKVESVTVDMGMPSLQPADIPVLSDTPFIDQTISLNCSPKLEGQSQEGGCNNSSFLTPHSSFILLVCWHYKAGCHTVTLFNKHEAFADEFVDYLFGVVADSDKFYIGVIEHFVFVFEFINHALEVDFVVVNAEREADGCSLYEA